MKFLANGSDRIVKWHSYEADKIFEINMVHKPFSDLRLMGMARRYIFTDCESSPLRNGPGMERIVFNKKIKCITDGL